MISKCFSYYFRNIISCFNKFYILQNTSNIQLNISKRNIKLQCYNRSKENKINEERKRNNIMRPSQSYEYNIFGNRMVDLNVCIIGGGLSSIYTTVLLKQSRFIKDIHLVDLSGKLAGTILDANHIDTTIRIKYFTKKLISKALVKVRYYNYFIIMK